MNIEEKNKAAAAKAKTNDIEKSNAEIVSKFTTLSDDLHNAATTPDDAATTPQDAATTPENAEPVTRAQLAMNANPVN